MCGRYLSCNKLDSNSSEGNSDYDDIYFNQYYDMGIKKNYTTRNRLILHQGDGIDNRYEILNNLGKGAFSDVYKCKDHKDNSLIALKVVRHEKRFHKAAEKENKIFEKLNNNTNECINIINLKRYFHYDDNIFFVFDIHGISLYSYYQEHSNIINLKDFSKQILNGLNYMHDLKIIHADLKPENILVKDNILKIIDLGSSFEEKENYYNDYIQSRWYRAPEVLFNKTISVKIDIWSYGCIIYELYYKKPLFLQKTAEGMRLSTLNFKSKLNIENYEIIPFNLSLNKLLKSSLQFNASERLNASELLNHQYFKTIEM